MSGFTYRIAALTLGTLWLLQKCDFGQEYPKECLDKDDDAGGLCPERMRVAALKDFVGAFLMPGQIKYDGVFTSREEGLAHGAIPHFELGIGNQPYRKLRGGVLQYMADRFLESRRIPQIACLETDFDMVVVPSDELGQGVVLGGVQFCGSQFATKLVQSGTLEKMAADASAWGAFVLTTRPYDTDEDRVAREDYVRRAGGEEAFQMEEEGFIRRLGETLGIPVQNFNLPLYNQRVVEGIIRRDPSVTRLELARMMFEIDRGMVTKLNRFSELPPNLENEMFRFFSDVFHVDEVSLRTTPPISDARISEIRETILQVVEGVTEDHFKEGIRQGGRRKTLVVADIDHAEVACHAFGLR